MTMKPPDFSQTFGRRAFSSSLRHAEGVEDRRLARVHLHLADQRGLESLDEAQDALVGFFVIDPDGLEAVGQLIAQDALHDVEIVMQQRRRGLLFGLGADVLPQVVEELHVAGDLFFGAAFGGGAGDESAHRAGPLALQNAFQPQAFFVAGDLARNAHVFERRHVDHVAARAARCAK